MKHGSFEYALSQLPPKIKENFDAKYKYLESLLLNGRYEDDEALERTECRKQCWSRSYKRLRKVKDDRRSSSSSAMIFSVQVMFDLVNGNTRLPMKGFERLKS